MEFVYFDNNLLRNIAKNPNIFNQTYDSFIRLFGRSYRLVESYYLFFEYIGFTKKLLEISPNFLTLNFVKKKSDSSKLVNKLDRSLRKFESNIYYYVKQKLYSLKPELLKLLQDQEKKENIFIGVQELILALFGRISYLLKNNFDEFVEDATIYLTWDIFCGINSKGIPLTKVREMQLGWWLKGWKEKKKLPVLKIIDDLAEYFKIKFKSNLKNYKDMVDNEVFTYLVLGYQDKSINCLTYRF